MEKTMMELNVEEMYEVEGGYMVACFNPEWKGDVNTGSESVTSCLQQSMPL